MLRDATTIEAGATLDADVCIVGSGPAGITLARELMSNDLRIVVLEAGGEDSEWRPEPLKGSTSGWSYPMLQSTRRRAFGGTSHAWSLTSNWLPDGGLRCHPLEPLDFETRSWVPHSGWPFGPEELQPYYERAHAICGLGPFSYDAGAAGIMGQPLTFPDGAVETTLFRFVGRERFIDLRPELARSPRVTVLIHANVIEVETGEYAQQVSRVRVKSKQGDFFVSSRVFILAGGGLEIPRLLLLSRSTYPEGLGNGNDLVGRFFMEHLTIARSTIVPFSSDFWTKLGLYRRQQVEGVATLGALKLSDETVRKEGLAGLIISPFVGRSVFYTSSVRSLSSLVFQLRHGHVPPRAHRLLPNIIRDPIPAALAVYLRFTNSITKKQDVFGLDAHFEQTPRPDNRVTLSDTLDGEGLNRVHLHWTLGELEERTVLRTFDILDDELRVAGIGWIRNKPSTAAFRRHVGVTHHHLGTTRMHSDPLHGVVDEDSKVHGISNLFIAGSSVFPTGGAATATMTLVTLAIRLADHVKTLLKPAVLTAEAPAAEV